MNKKIADSIERQKSENNKYKVKNNPKESLLRSSRWDTLIGTSIKIEEPPRSLDLTVFEDFQERLFHSCKSEEIEITYGKSIQAFQKKGISERQAKENVFFYIATALKNKSRKFYDKLTAVPGFPEFFNANYKGKEGYEIL